MLGIISSMLRMSESRGRSRPAWARMLPAMKYLLHKRLVRYLVMNKSLLFNTGPISILLN